jgi:hypothetical protein
MMLYPVALLQMPYGAAWWAMLKNLDAVGQYYFAELDPSRSTGQGRPSPQVQAAKALDRPDKLA